MGRREDHEEKKRLRNSLADFFELPKEVVLNVCQINIVGNIQLHLENHRGVIEYTEEIVRISVNNGEVIVRGRDLRIKNLLSEEIFIEGKFDAVEFEE